MYLSSYQRLTLPVPGFEPRGIGGVGGVNIIVTRSCDAVAFHPSHHPTRTFVARRAGPGREMMTLFFFGAAATVRGPGDGQSESESDSDRVRVSVQSRQRRDESQRSESP